MSDAPDVDVRSAFEALVAGIADLPATLTLPIEPAIRHQGADYTRIELREPKADQVRRAEEQLRSGPGLPHNRRNYEIQLVSAVAGVPFAVAQQMGVATLNVAMGYLDAFLAYGRGIGGI